MTERSEPEPIARRRLLGFGRHLAGYFAAITVPAVVNPATTPDNPWFIRPMVGYGGILAVHAAQVMGLFDGLTRKVPA